MTENEINSLPVIKHMLASLELTRERSKVFYKISGEQAWMMSNAYSAGYHFEFNIAMQDEHSVLVNLRTWRKRENDALSHRGEKLISDFEFAVFIKGSLWKRRQIRSRINRN